MESLFKPNKRKARTLIYMKGEFVLGTNYISWGLKDIISTFRNMYRTEKIRIISGNKAMKTTCHREYQLSCNV